MSSAKNDYETEGCVVLRSLLDKDEISALALQVEHIYKQWQSANKSNIYDYKLVNMHSLTSPEYFQEHPQQRLDFFNALASIKLTKALESMFGTNLYFHNTQLFFNPTNKERLPYWHRDQQYSQIEDAVQRAEQNKMLSLHVRIPLLPEKGLELIKGSHKRWDTNLEKNVRFELDGHKNSDSLPDSTLIELEVGDVLIFNSQMIHRGNYELNPERKALDLCIGKPHPLVSGFLDPNVLPTKEELDKIENKQWYQSALSLVTK